MPTKNRNAVILSFRGVFLAAAFMILALSTLAVPVLAQTVTIAKVDYTPSVVYGSTDLLSVQALVEYSGAGRGTDYFLTVTLLDQDKNSSSIRGNDVNLVANPTPCGGITGYIAQGTTFCPIVLRSPSGSETVRYTFSSSHASLPPVWDLAILASLGQVNALSPSDAKLYNFTIEVTAQPGNGVTVGLESSSASSTETEVGLSPSQLESLVLVIFVLFLLLTVYAVWPRRARRKARRRR
jgi:hypothetical protein